MEMVGSRETSRGCRNQLGVQLAVGPVSPGIDFMGFSHEGVGRFAR